VSGPTGTAPNTPSPPATARPPSTVGAAFEYEPASDLDLPLAVRLGRYPREPELLTDLARALGRRLTAGLTRLLCRLRVVGAPPDLPRLALVANHGSHLDTLAILAALPERQRRRVAVFAAQDYFFRTAPAAIAAAILGQGIAYDRSDIGELRRWTRVLRDQPSGWFIAYPSGSRRSEELHGGLLGVLAKSGWAIVPVSLRGTREAWPVGRAMPRLFRPIEVCFGAPIEVDDEHELVAAVAAAWAAPAAAAAPATWAAPAAGAAHAPEERR
jgi:1-acyl-sn-glycerol-3-phosphate acyltransferase